MSEKPGRDRDGEPFEDDFTDDRGVSPGIIEEQSHDLDLEGDQISENGDEPVKKEPHAAEKDR